MTQRSLHWDGASVGDADLLTVNAGDGIGYRLGNEDYESPLVDRMFRMLWNGDEDRGVLKNWGGELAVTGVATPVVVATGGAVVYGMPYQNTTAPLNIAVPNPTTDTRQDLIVLRRNWAAQTIRATRIAGVEGGGVPAHTQSPAPSGSGIYDIPLASLSITTGGVITVTDMREYCLFGTGIADGAFATAHLSNSSIDWLDRETATKRTFLGGGDLEPALTAGKFSYGLLPASAYTMTAAPTWGGGAANEEAWRHTGTGYRGVNFVFRTPPDYASGSITAYIWWVCNAAVAQTFYIRCVIQDLSQDFSSPVVYTSDEYITGTGVVNNVTRTDGPIILSTYITGGDFWNGWVGIYNAADGGEDINIMGVELEYTGYV